MGGTFNRLDCPLKPLAEQLLPFSMNTRTFSDSFTANTHIGQTPPSMLAESQLRANKSNQRTVACLFLDGGKLEYHREHSQRRFLIAVLAKTK